MKQPNIETRTQRRALPQQKNPYWKRLEPGFFLGYRPAPSGDGTWSARWRDEDGRQHQEALGAFDEYRDAKRAAEAWLQRVLSTGTVTKPPTVAEACRAYVQERRTTKGEATAKDADGRFTRLVYGAPLAKITLDKLRADHLRQWRDSLVQDGEDDSDDDTRRARSSANRSLRALKAALNLSRIDHKMPSREVLDGVPQFKTEGGRRELVLDVDQESLLLQHARSDFADFCRGLLLTGARVGELAAAKVADYTPAKQTLRLSGKTGERIVPVSPKAAALLDRMVKDAMPAAPLFRRQDGSGWTKDYWRDHFQKTRRAAGLPDELSAYTLRHTFITKMCSAGVPTLTVARLCGTSVAMIDKNYGHLAHDHAREALALAEGAM